MHYLLIFITFSFFIPYFFSVSQFTVMPHYVIILLYPNWKWLPSVNGRPLWTRISAPLWLSSHAWGMAVVLSPWISFCLCGARCKQPALLSWQPTTAFWKCSCKPVPNVVSVSFFQINYNVPGGRISPSVSEVDLRNPQNSIKKEVRSLLP